MYKAGDEMEGELIKRLTAFGVIPVIKIGRPEDALPLADALRRGGLPVAEITFRTDAAEESIRRISEAYPDFLVGAGTVLTTSQADKAMAAGAEFLVSPGTNPLVVAHCLKNGYRIIPGVCTPSEVEQALSSGLKYLKFFPAEAAGGVKMIKAMAAPYPDIRFMPTGGINLQNLPSYLGTKTVFACGGSWITPEDLINAGRFADIEVLVKEAVAKIKEIRQ